MTTMMVGVNIQAGMVAERLLRLAHLYQEGQASPLLIQTLDKVFAYEIAEARTQLEQLRTDLAAFEAQYAMPSPLFYHRYQQGQMDDRMDFVEWASLVQMADNLEKRLHLLTDENEL
jgi:hypothetical protein